MVDGSKQIEFEAVVAGRRSVAEGVVELSLRRRDGAALPAWAPGAHIDLVLGDGLVRQYSLCGPLADASQYRIAVRRDDDGRGGSRQVHDTVGVGDVVVLRGPRNHFVLEDAPGYVFVAGGIGITPLLPMIEAARDANTDFRLYYCGRRRASMAYCGELARDERVTILPKDEEGPLRIDEILEDTPSAWPVYCCGPETLLAAFAQSCSAQSGRALRVERFTPVPVPGEQASEDHDFTVELAVTGGEVEVPADRRLLDVLWDSGVNVMTSCEEGTCGTCETAVLAGEPDHRDSVLSPEERAANDRIIVCVSRARSCRLVLDL
ncbi:PDR/VanB family oxidoreductase [Amycolatopsis sp. NPDC051372]|uniref:PDR/VanB family oxidoreductase n=1 Tax=unclassified Amycolatopsis TaxID=2618356 RepID=UPI00342495BD